MPLMFLISGLFSKNLKKPIWNTVKQLLIPFIIFNVSYQIFQNLLTNHQAFDVEFLKTCYGSWFLLTLFYYRIIIKFLGKFPLFNLILALLLHFFSGFISNMPDILTFTRALNFYVYFAVGYYLTIDQITYLSSILKKRTIALIMIAYLPLHYLLANYAPIGKLQKLDQVYSFYDQSASIILSEMLITMLITFALSLVLLNLVSKNYNSILSHIGKRTMIIYLGHLYIMLLFRSYFDITLKFIPSLIIVPLFITVVISFILYLDKKLKLEQII